MEANGPHAITVVHTFDAPRELVFRQWIDSADVRTWFAPDNCTVTFCEVDARPGGRWRIEYRHDLGGEYVEYGEFHEVVEPERLVFSLTQEDGKGNVGHKTLVTVRFATVGARTEMTFTQTGFETSTRRDDNAQGWNECFRKLRAHIEQSADDDGEIRALIGRWANAVQHQDIETVVAHHAMDLSMFDVPPPNELRGIEAYRASWAPFFEHFEKGGVFAIERLEVTTGDRVAFATALLTCGTKKELEKNPTIRLRLTVGLRKERGHWIVAHEHHSFPLEPA
jgi:uncharacterized protein (TIGR02246 family)